MPEINWDFDDLESLTQKEILIQICLRLDRQFPTQQSVAIYEAAVAEARALLGGFKDGLIDLGLQELADKIDELV